MKLPSAMKFQDRDVAHAHCSVWSCYADNSFLYTALRMPTTTSSTIQTWQSEAKFLGKSSGHLLIFQDIQERFTVCKSK